MKFFEYNASKVWFADANVHVELEDGRQAFLPIKKFPLLFKASPHELEKFEIINGYALYWPDLGEDLSVARFFEQLQDNDSKQAQTLSVSK